MPAAFSVDITARRGTFVLQVAFEAEHGITVVTGPSGAGKSTLVDVIAGAITPDRGTIKVVDRVLYDHASINLKPGERRAGYVLQDTLLFPHLTVHANLTFGGEGNNSVGMDDIIELLDIAPLLDRRPHELSGGERRRVALGRAILANPNFLLMDEPLANLDAQRRNDILPLIETMRDRFRIPIMYVTHSWPEIIRLADTVIVMDAGKVAASGNLQDVLSAISGPEFLVPGGAVLEAKVETTENGLTRLGTAAGPIFIPDLKQSPGDTVRLFVNATDIALSLNYPVDISVQNILQAVVGKIADRTEHNVDVTLKLADGQCLIARITRQACTRLGLKIDQPLYALIKSVALDRDLFHHPSL